MKQLATILLACLLTSPILAQEPEPKVPVTPKKVSSVNDIKASAGEIITIAPDTKGNVSFAWDKTAFPVAKKRAVVDGNKLYLTTTVNGKYVVVVADFAAMTQTEWYITVTGGTNPEDPPLIPDVPKDVTLEALAKQVAELTVKFEKFASAQIAYNLQFDQRLKHLETSPPVPPKPVDPPKPPVTDYAFPLDGKFRVYVNYEEMDKETGKYTNGQIAAIIGVPVRTYLETHCAQGPGTAKEYKIWDKDIPVAGQTPTWVRAAEWARKMPLSPGKDGAMVVGSVIISNGKENGEFRGALPPGDNEFLELLKKYGGP